MKNSPTKLECYYWGIVLGCFALQFDNIMVRIFLIVLFILVPLGVKLFSGRVRD